MLRVIERKIRGKAIAYAMLVVVVLSSPQIARGETSCFLGYQRLQAGFYQMQAGYRSEAEFWSNYKKRVFRERARRLNAAAQENLQPRVANPVGDGLSEVSGSAGNSAHASAPARRVVSAVADSALGLRDEVLNFAASFPKGLRDWIDQPTMRARVRRTFLRPRADRTGASVPARVLDTIQDPISGLLQSSVVRRGIRSVTAGQVRVPRPQVEATLLTSALAYGTVANYFYFRPAARRANENCEKTVLIETNRGAPGSMYLSLWQNAGLFTDTCAFARSLEKHLDAFEEWRTGVTGIWTKIRSYIDLGFLGKLTARDSKAISDVFDLLNDATVSEGRLNEALDALAETQRELFFKAYTLNDLLQRSVALTDVQRGASEFEVEFAKVWQAALQASAVTAPWLADPKLRAHLSAILTPTLMIGSRSDLEWLALLEQNAERAAFSKVRREALAAAAQVHQAWLEMPDTSLRERIWSIGLAQRTLRDAQIFANFEARETSADAERTQLMSDVAKLNARLDSENLNLQLRSLLLAERDQKLLGLRRAESRLSAVREERMARDVFFRKRMDALTIPNFCLHRECIDQNNSLLRADAIPFTVPLEFVSLPNDGTSVSTTLDSEMDYWRLAFTNPLFVDYAGEKAQSLRSDTDVLRDLSIVIEGYTDLFREQREVLGDATAIEEKLNAGAQLAPLEPARACRLMGEFANVVNPAGGQYYGNSLFTQAREYLEAYAIAKNLSRDRKDYCRYALALNLWEYFAEEGVVAAHLDRELAELRQQLGAETLEFKAASLRALENHQHWILDLRESLVAQRDGREFSFVEQILESCTAESSPLPPIEERGALDCESFID